MYPFNSVLILRTLIGFKRCLANRMSTVTDSNPTKILAVILKYWLNHFKKNEISEPLESIQNILLHVIGKRTYPDLNASLHKSLSNEQIQKVHNLCQKRLKKLPIQYVIGEWQFRELTLLMVPPVFIPRPETEILVDIVLSKIQHLKNLNILELCCGSGAISLSLLKNVPHFTITAIDQSQDACNLASLNADRYQLNSKLKIIQLKLTHQIVIDKNYFADNFYDVIVSNPPYVFTEDLDGLQPEIKLYEDLQALDGGVDGMHLIEIILQLAYRILAANGVLFLEIEPRHPELIRKWLDYHNNVHLKVINVYKGFNNESRFIEIAKLMD